jgi:hypothetical protein
MERLHHLTGIESSVKEIGLELLEKLTGAKSPEPARALEQLHQSGSTEQSREDAVRDPGSMKGQLKYEELEDAKRDGEGTHFSYDKSTPGLERTRELDRTQEHEIVHEIEHDFSMDRGRLNSAGALDST